MNSCHRPATGGPKLFNTAGQLWRLWIRKHLRATWRGHIDLDLPGSCGLYYPARDSD